MTLDANVGFTNTAAKSYRAFPASVPMPFGFRDNTLVANCDPTGDILTLNFGVNFTGGNIPVTLGVDVARSAVGPGTKQANRDRYVALNLANAAGGTQGPWCLGIPDVFRLKAVYLGGNSSVSNTNVNVVNDFYIDTNQSADFLDLSYLYLDPASDLVLNNTQWLLVQFDHFSVTNPGFYATTSYVSSNVAQLQLTDALPLANLGSQINTMEIPVVHTAQGQNLDLLNNFDFRPTAANTVASSTLIAGCPVNPPYALSFGNTADPTTYQKFPNPASTMVVDTEQWLGRVDSVFCTSDGNIVTLHGSPGPVLDVSKAPNQPKDTMLLNSIVIPPYPTVAQVPSKYVLDVLNTKRANENTEENRIQAWTARTLLANSDINANQPMGYDMKDIGNLDHRLTAVEYYVSLNELESDVTRRVIPSSVDPSTDRFKFGFFADDYSSNNYQESTNPQYQAQIISDDLWPKSLTWTVTHGSGNCCHMPYVDWPIVDQTYASGPPPSTACYQDVTTSNTFHYRLCGRDSSEQNSGKVKTKYFTFDVPATTGQITVYVWAESGGSRMNIWQGNTLYLRGNNAVLLTATDKTTITAQTFEQNWFGGCDCTDDTTSYPDDCSVPQCCKIVWNHNPSGGNTYTIVFTASNCYMDWKVAVEYVVSSTVTKQVPCPLPPQPTCPKTTCTGTMDPTCGPKHNCKEHKKVCTGYVKVKCCGMKPKTKHTCQSDKRGDISHACRPIGGNCGDPIFSDHQGKCEFEVLLDVLEAIEYFVDNDTTKRDDDHNARGDHDNDKHCRSENLSICGTNSYASCKSVTRKQPQPKCSGNNKWSR